MNIPPDQAAAIITAGVLALGAFLTWLRAWFGSKTKNLEQKVDRNTDKMAEVDKKSDSTAHAVLTATAANNSVAAQALKSAQAAAENTDALTKQFDTLVRQFKDYELLWGQYRALEHDMVLVREDLRVLQVSDGQKAERIEALSAQNQEQGQRIADLESHIDQLYEGIGLLSDGERQLALSKVTGQRPNGKHRKGSTPPAPPPAPANVDSTT